MTTLLLFAGTSLYVSIVNFAAALDATVFALVAALVFSPKWSDSRPAAYTGWALAALLPIAARYVTGPDAAPQALFSPDRGFLALHPASYIAAFGTLASLRRDPFWAGGTLALLLLWLAAGADLTGAVALLAPGLAVAIEWARRRPLVAIAPLVAFAIAWNYWLMVQYTAGTIPKDAPVSFAAMVRQQADVHTRAPYVYPFAFPANVLFAWREGVPVSRYDVLSTQPRRESFELTIERGAEPFLLDGWGPPGANDTGPFRWIDAPQATLVFPLQPSTSDMLVSIVATARGGEHSSLTGLTFRVNDTVIGGAGVSPAAPTEARVIIRGPDVGRILRKGYNRLSIVTSGSHRVAIHRIRIVPVS